MMPRAQHGGGLAHQGGTGQATTLVSERCPTRLRAASVVLVAITPSTCKSPSTRVHGCIDVAFGRSGAIFTNSGTRLPCLAASSCSSRNTLTSLRRVCSSCSSRRPAVLGGENIHRHIVCQCIHLAQTQHIISSSIGVRCVLVFADIDTQQTGFAFGALDIAHPYIHTVIVEAMRLITASCWGRRNMRGLGLPACGSGVTAAYFHKAKPQGQQGINMRAFLSIPAARPTGLGRSGPIP